MVAWPGGWAGALLLAALTVAVLLAMRHRLPRRLLAAGTAAVVAGALPVAWLASGWPPAGAVVVACAVGQGDLLVVPVRAGEAIVVDAGPEPAAADRCLRDLGRLARCHCSWSPTSTPIMSAGVGGVFRGRRVGGGARRRLAGAGARASPAAAGGRRGGTAAVAGCPSRAPATGSARSR